MCKNQLVKIKMVDFSTVKGKILSFDSNSISLEKQLYSDKILIMIHKIISISTVADSFELRDDPLYSICRYKITDYF